MRKRAFLTSALYSCLFSALLLSLNAAGGQPAPRRQFAQAASAPAEVEKLREELARAKAEIKRLKEENERLKGELGQRSKELGQRTQELEQRTQQLQLAKQNQPVAVAELPPLKPAEVVPVTDLLNHYRANPAAADARYKDKILRIQGVAERFEPPWAGLTQVVFLRGADQLSVVRCHVKFPGMSDIVISKDGKKMVGNPPFGKERTLMAAGQTVALEGKCAGIHQNAVVFDKCRPSE